MRLDRGMKQNKKRQERSCFIFSYLVMMVLMPWGVHADGIERYREGHYLQAAEELSVAKPDATTDYYIGNMRLYGYGLLRNNIIALRHLRAAAQSGSLPAQQLLARYELKEHHLEQALGWFKKSAESNDLQAQLYCAAAYLFGIGTSKNVDQANRYFIAAARNGNSIAQYALADSFLDTKHSSNNKLGLIWLNKAVAQNNPAAQLKLADLYDKGTLVPMDKGKAKELVSAALAQGYVPALYQMGKMAEEEGQFDQAKAWYMKAQDAHYEQAEIALSDLYRQEKASFYDLNKGFLWMLRAAQNGSAEAQVRVAELYKTGVGTEKNEALAKMWQDKAAVTQKHPNPAAVETEAAFWLSNGKEKTLTAGPYRLIGILGNWYSADALKENNYNQPPRMNVVTREMLYKPQFVMTKPNEIPISDFYDALARSLSTTAKLPSTFPHYALNPPAAALPSQSAVPALKLGSKGPEKGSTLTVDQLKGRAVLGDPLAQFALGQMYQEGVNVPKNIEEAIRYYQLASDQQELRAEYNLGLIYLEGDGVPADYEKAISLLRDAAFKGNDYAQFTLAHLTELGYRNGAGEVIIQPDQEQALAMYNLAAANDYGPAQYRLAELMVRQKPTDLSVLTKQKQYQKIKQLYEAAFTAGIEQAAVPLAYFSAMDTDKAKQEQALVIAKKEANAGNSEAALLLGLMYDRGIAVDVNPREAVYWYQQATVNPVSAFILGTYMVEGTEMSQDKQKGEALLKQAADGSFPYANFNLAVLKQQNKEEFLPELEKALTLGNSTAGLLLADYYLSLASNDTQMQQARNIYQSLAEKGDRNGQLKLAYMLDKGLGGPADRVNAEKWYRQAADQDQAVAQYFLGQYYQLGKLDTKPDYTEAKKWYSKASNRFTPAANALGFIYETVDNNYAEALVAYQQAADKNDPIGQFNLGLIFEKGKGFAVDLTKAENLYQLAAEHGLSPAMVQLAGLYFNGINGARDTDQALLWYKKAAGVGDRDALYQLGLLSETGVVMKLDFAQAIQYYQQSSDKGDAKAMLALARIYQYGLGITKNMQQAVHYYKVLASLGSAYAQYQLAMIYYEGKETGLSSTEGKVLLQQAQDNGSLQARRVLLRLQAQAQHSSFIEPVLMSPSNYAEQPVDLMYMDALNDWNRGDENASRVLLNKILLQFPHYMPAKRAYEQLNQQVSQASKIFG